MRSAALVFLFLGGPGAGQPEIDDAVRRGVAWLRKEQDANGQLGSNAGETALGLLALRHSGVPAADPGCVKAAKHLERALPDGSVYGAALGTLALLAQSPERHRKEIAKLVAHLVRGQCRNGQWSYAYRATKRKKSGDNSNTQIAILALAAARARRFDVPDEALERCRDYFVRTQNEDGGFGYGEAQRRRSYGSMTAGGAMALTLTGAKAEAARAHLWLATEFDPKMNRGAARAFGKKKGNRSDNFWKHYWLWSLERACSSAGLKTLGPNDWYGAGARYLVGSQRKDGSWKDPERPIQASCFALLFLARKTHETITPRDKDRAAKTKREKEITGNR
ncbi:MAG: prenyltransferase/squalene oxidase repeat-containing protein [Planctomycetota bacterium]